MKQGLPWLTVAMAVAVLGGSADPAAAGDAMIQDEVDAHSVEAPAPTLLGTPALDAAELAAQRGGADTHLSDLRAVGSVSEVAVSEVATGHNLITGGALSGASGIPMFIQNSGNGVLIQNAVILNVDVQ